MTAPPPENQFVTNEPEHRTLSLLAAVADNGVIGHKGQLPWRLPADLKHFKSLTVGHTVIMGRKTFESIGKPLPRRRSIVVTHQQRYDAQGAEVAGSIEQALDLARDDDAIFIIGGRSIYEAALPYANRIDLTRVHGHPEGDVQFPELDLSRWQIVESQEHPADEANDYPMTFQTFHRRAATKSPDV
jgi:dihydrofolate reductase